MTNFDHNYQRWQRANRIVQQLRRRKSVSCLEPVNDTTDDETRDIPSEDRHITTTSRLEHSYSAIKRASSDYIKSGNGSLERLRNFQLDWKIGKSPLMIHSCSQRMKSHKLDPAAGNCNPSIKFHSARIKTHRTGPKGNTSDFKNNESQKASRCAQTINPSRNLTICSYRKALSPIEDGDASSPDQLCHQDQAIHCEPSHISTSAFPSSPQSGISASSSTSSIVSQASSACSPSVIHRSTSRASIDQSVGNSAAVQVHKHIKHPQHHLQHHPFLAQYYEGGKVRPHNLNSGARQSTPSTMPVCISDQEIWSFDDMPSFLYLILIICAHW